ncbi:hypothetical protein [Bradyrhizobium genosp. P]|uniref:hypothetical protein n=1 Tax=Bradyrhizobium genosp. P TaxID=83641 RepID=UPI003CEA079B
MTPTECVPAESQSDLRPEMDAILFPSFTLSGYLERSSADFFVRSQFALRSRTIL